VLDVETTHVLEVEGLERLVEALVARDYDVVAPRVADGAIALDLITHADQLPIGRGDEQAPGRYRLTDRDDEARFGYAVGPTSPKRWLLPPRSQIFQATAEGDAFRPEAATTPDRRHAFLGLRPCELAGVAKQDRVFIRDDLRDALYADRRDQALLIVVHCGDPAGTCFCASLGTGPRAEAGFDLALTEVLGEHHRFVVEVGSDAGAELVAELDLPPATEADLSAARAVTDRAADSMGRSLDTEGLREDLLGALESPRYRDVARRCLACGSCTLLCPTCFCTGMVDSSELDGSGAARTRVWDSCFTIGFSYIHGQSIRSSVAARYRQWLTHKLATWADQFGELGCVGCGRCITWCPVGIDITEEARAIRATAVPQAVPQEDRP